MVFMTISPLLLPVHSKKEAWVSLIGGWGLRPDIQQQDFDLDLGTLQSSSVEHMGHFFNTAMLAPHIDSEAGTSRQLIVLLLVSICQFQGLEAKKVLLLFLPINNCVREV